MKTGSVNAYLVVIGGIALGYFGLSRGSAPRYESTSGGPIAPTPLRSAIGQRVSLPFSPEMRVPQRFYAVFTSCTGCSSGLAMVPWAKLQDRPTFLITADVPSSEDRKKLPEKVVVITLMEPDAWSDRLLAGAPQVCLMAKTGEVLDVLDLSKGDHP